MKKRTRIRLALRRAASAVAEAMADDPGLDDELLAEVRGRAASAMHTSPDVLGSYYVRDVQLLLDELDRLRYEVDRSPR